MNARLQRAARSLRTARATGVCSPNSPPSLATTRSHRSWAHAMAVIAALLATPTVASATTFTVTSTGDAADAAAGNGVCATAGAACTLRAAIQETNALVAGAPHIITFAIPTADAGFNVGTGVFTIVPASLYPAISRAGTSLDATTQASSAAGNTNAGVLGTGGSVGVEGLALPQVQRPEILVRDNAALTTGLSVTASNVEIRGFAIHGFGTAATNGDIVLTGATTGVRITGNLIGSTPTAFALPAVAAQQSAGNAITINAPDSGFVQNNLIGFAGFHGIVARGGAAGWTISGNETAHNGRTNNASGGIALEAAGTINTMVRGNLITGSGGAGLETAANTGPNTSINNTIAGNGVFNNATAETPGIRLLGSNNLVDRNVVSANYGAGVMVVSAAATNRISRNSISANGTILNLGGTAATGQIGIDLLVAADSQTRGTSPFRSLNDTGDADVGANALTNFPVLVSAERVGESLMLSGFARPGAIVELFVAAPDGAGFGEGQTYLTTVVEGSGGDADDTTGLYGPGPINSVAQGTDTTNRFVFTIPTSTLPTPVPAGALITATATLLGATSEFSGNVTVTAAAADLTVAITDAPDPVIVGQPLTYTVTVTNSGPGVASAITTTHTLPPGTILTGAVPSQGTCSHLLGTVTCALGDLPNGANATIVVGVIPNVLGVITSSVSGSAAQTDPTTPNVANSTTTVVSNADVGVVIVDAPDPVASGQPLVATISVTNAGPDDARDVTLTDVLSGSGTFSSIGASQGSCTALLVCTLGTIPAGGSASVTVTTIAGAPGTITHTATATTTSTDGVPSNDTRAETATVVATADVELTIGDAPDPVALGQTLTYTLVASNAGPDPAFGVTVTNFLPPQLTFVSATPSQGSCAPAISCALGTIAPGTSAIVVVAATATAIGPILNGAQVTTASSDPLPGNNVATAITDVTAPVDLQITATASPMTVLVGSPTTAFFAVTNASPLTATGVVVTHLVPPGTVVGPIGPSQGSCTQAGQLLTCELGALAPATQATITVALTPTVAGALTFGATVAGDQGDPNLPNTASALVTVVSPPPAVPDLSVTVNTSRTGVSAVGDVTAITAIVTNGGAGVATGVTVSVRVDGASVVSIRTSSGKCSTTRTGAIRTTTCSVGRLEPGARTTVAIIAQALTRRRIPASASATADQADPTPADATSIAATSRPPVGRLTVRVDAPRTIRRSQLMSYTVTVRNGGTQVARDAVVAVVPPAGSRPGFVTVRTLQGVSTGRVVTLVVGDLQPGQTRVISLLAFVGARLGTRRIAAAAITADGVSGGHTAQTVRVLGTSPSVPVTG
mgnify:CR=1 FL=1